MARKKNTPTIMPPAPGPTGWIPPFMRSDAQHQQHEAAMAVALPRFHLEGTYHTVTGRFELFRAVQQVLRPNNPQILPYNWQVTGSCVGAAGGNMLKTLMCVEIAAGEAEEYRELFWLFTYGRSRLHAGMPDPGEGSFGSAWAKAIKEDGSLHLQEVANLPQPAVKDGWIQFGSSTERQYSDGDAKVNLDLMPTARLHPVGSFVRIRSADEGKAAIANGYPLTQASMFGTRGAKRQGDPPVMVAEWDAQWAHQMWFDSSWDHPSLGLLFRLANNWGPSAHEKPVGADEPLGGFWITARTFDRICGGRDGEVFAFSAFEGFKARELDFFV